MGIGPLELLIMLIIVGLPVLLIVMLVRRSNGSRPCPHCGTRVKNGQTECGACDYDFRLQAKPASR